MKASLYATVGDRVDTFKNKHGEIEHRTVEGKVVLEDVPCGDELTPSSFKQAYDFIKAAHPDAIVRYAKDPK